MSLKDYKSFFLIGIGGAGMSAIAHVLKNMGYVVSGSDMKESRYTNNLANSGVEIFIGHNPSNLKDSDAVVYSSAIPENNIELIAARKKRMPEYSRSDILSWLLNNKKGIAIAGTHGKTTTTSMISLILRSLNLDPTIIVGGELNELGTNARYGRSDLLVAEACESDGSFLKYKPFISVVTNIEEDHFDFYENINQIKNSFNCFINNTRKDGFVVLNGDEIEIDKSIKSGREKIICFGLEESNDIYAKNIKLKNFTSSFTLVVKDGSRNREHEISLNVPGVHNIKNSLAAFSVCKILELNMDEAAGVLKYFTGVKRRFEKRGEKLGAFIYDDYAHHPSEVKATLDAASNDAPGRMITVFQPHRYSRLANMKDKFNDCFNRSDILIITDVYAAGEEPLPGINGKLLVDNLIESGFKNELIYIPKLNEIHEYLNLRIKKNDIIMLMGAGDITRVTDELLKNN